MCIRDRSRGSGGVSPATTRCGRVAGSSSAIAEIDARRRPGGACPELAQRASAAPDVGTASNGTIGQHPGVIRKARGASVLVDPSWSEAGRGIARWVVGRRWCADECSHRGAQPDEIVSRSGIRAEVADREPTQIAQGVIDPVKLTRSALANAASIASLLLTTETSVVDKPADDEDDHGHGHSH